MAGWCQTGHCAETTSELPSVLAAKRSELRGRIGGLEHLDAKLAALERHLTLTELPMVGGPAPCCSAAAAVGESFTV